MRVHAFENRDGDGAVVAGDLLLVDQPQPGHVVEQGGDGRVASQSDFRNDDPGRSYGVVEERGSVVAGHARQGGAGPLEGAPDGGLAVGIEGLGDQREEVVVACVIGSFHRCRIGFGSAGRLRRCAGAVAVAFMQVTDVFRNKQRLRCDLPGPAVRKRRRLPAA